MKDKSIPIIAVVALLSVLALATGFKQVPAPAGWKVNLALDHVEASAAGEPATRQTVRAGSAQRVTVDLHQPVGDLQVRKGAPNLLAATFHTEPSSWVPTATYSIEGTVGRLAVLQDDHRSDMAGLRNQWDIRLGAGLPMDLTVEQGAGKADLELGRLSLASLRFTGGAGETIVDLRGFRAPHADVPVQLERGVGSTTLIVPNDVPARVTVTQARGSVKPHGFARQADGTWTNGAYQPGKPAVVAAVTQGPGEVRLEAR